MGMSLSGVRLGRGQCTQGKDVQKTAAEGAKDEEALLARHFEAPNEVDGERP